MKGYTPTPDPPRASERAAQNLSGLKWRKVTAPKPWYPKEGEELLGFYGGRTLKSGSFGQYEIVIVHIPYAGSWSVSGTNLIQLLDASLVAKGAPIKVVFKGVKPLPTEVGEKQRTMKLFDLFVTDGMPMSPADLAAVGDAG